MGNFEWWGQERKIKRTSQPKSEGWVEVGDDIFFLIFALIASDFNRHIITIIINGENGVDEYTFCLHSMVNCIGEKTVLISN